MLIGWNSVLIPALIRAVEHEFHRSDAAFGLFYLISSLLYAAGAFSGGLLTERIGRRIVLTTGVLVLAVGLIAEGLAPVWPALLAAVVPAGWGSGVIDGGVNGLFLDLYRETRGGALNRLHVFFSIGALVAPYTVGLLLTAGAPWRLVLLLTAAGALPVALLLGRQPLPSGRHDRAAPLAAAELSPAERSLLPFAGLALSIACYVAAEVGVSNWVVKFLASVPVATATGVLSLFWGGLALGRLLSSLIAERIAYNRFTIFCVLAASLALIAAVLAPAFPASAALFGVTGLFFGPIYPMIMALGGTMYPRRLATLSGGLATAAVIGSSVYPPLMGVLATRIGLRGGLIGGGLLGLVTIAGIVVACTAARRVMPPQTESSVAR